MIFIFESILPIFLIMLLGKVIKSYWLTSEEFWRGLEKMSYFILFPCTLFNYIANTDLSVRNISSLVMCLILASIILIILLLIFQHQLKVDPKSFSSIFQGSTRYNSYIFFALSNSLYQEQSLSIVAVVSAYMIIFCNVATILFFNFYVNESSDHLLKSFYRNPLIISSILGICFNHLGIKIGFSLGKTLEILSAAALTIGIVNVGARLKLILKISDIKKICFASCNKLLVLPIITFAILNIFGISGMLKEVGLLYSGLPCSASAYLLSQELGGDVELMASITTFTTILSVFSLPLLMYILN